MHTSQAINDFRRNVEYSKVKLEAKLKTKARHQIMDAIVMPKTKQHYQDPRSALIVAYLTCCYGDWPGPHVSMAPENTVAMC